MKSVLHPALVAALLAASATTASGEAPPTWWQLQFEYDASSLVLREAIELAPMLKTPRTPGLDGAPGVLELRAEWLNAAGDVVFDGNVELPFGARSTLAPDGPCTAVVPTEDVLVVRWQGPAYDKAPASLRLTRTGARRMGTSTESTPPALAWVSSTLPIGRLLQATATPRVPGPQSAAKIRDTGPDSNRLVIVVVGDGYTAANLGAGAFVTAASSLANSFTGRSPWDVYYDATNIWRIDTESNEEGADNEDGQFGTQKDTYYNSAFWTSGIERLLAIDTTGRNRAISAANAYVGAGMWDFIFVLVNSTKYGGSGGSVCVSSVHPSSPDIIIHEMGHTFGQLADEYSTPYPGYPPGDPEANVDFDASGPGLKWLVWVEPGTPLPTPDTSAYNNVVGTFEGARYLSTGIYRPWRNCLMRSLGVNFCPVCKEQHIMRFHFFTQLADERSPATGGNYVVPAEGSTFAITPLPLSTLTYAWDINGSAIAGETSPSILVTPAMIGEVGVNKTLRLTVTDSTSMVRKTAPAETFTWGVLTNSSPSSVGGQWDAY